MALRPGTALLFITLGKPKRRPSSGAGPAGAASSEADARLEQNGHLFMLLTAESRCQNIYQDFSGCILRLGENMARYEEEAEEDKENQSPLQELQVVCGYWNEFHSCAMATLWVCQKEMVTVWEKLRKESRKIKFEGNLFDLCISSNYQNLHSTQIPTLFVLSITLMLTWLNL